MRRWLVVLLAVTACSEKVSEPDPPWHIKPGQIGSGALELARPVLELRRGPAPYAVVDCDPVVSAVRDLGLLMRVAGSSDVQADKVIVEVTLDEVMHVLYSLDGTVNSCHDVLREAQRHLQPVRGLSWTLPLNQLDADARLMRLESCPANVSPEALRSRACGMTAEERIRTRTLIEQHVRDAAKAGGSISVSAASLDADALVRYLQLSDDAHLKRLHEDLVMSPPAQR